MEKNLDDKQKKGPVITIIAVLIVVAIVGFIGFKVYQYFDLAKQATVFADEMDKVVSNLTDDSDIDMTIYSTGDVGELEKYMKNNAYDFQGKSRVVTQIQDDFILLDSTALSKDDSSLSTHKKTLAELESATNEMYDSMLVFFDVAIIKEKINALNLPSADEEELISEIEDVYVSYYNATVEAKEISVELFDKYEEAIELLASDSTNWYISGGQLYISSSSLLSSYNAVISEINTLSTEISDFLDIH